VMSDGTKWSERESIETELRALRVRGPRPALRERVILAAGQAAPPRERRGGWGVEMVLAAAILLVLALTGAANSGSSRPPAPAVVAAEVDAATRETCRLLGRAPQDWECRRLAIAARAPASDVARPLRSWIDTGTLEGGMP
jgi:hypothetical protein